MSTKFRLAFAGVIVLSLIAAACAPAPTAAPPAPAVPTEAPTTVPPTEAPAVAPPTTAPSAAAKTVFEQAREDTFNQLVGFTPPTKEYHIGALLITLANPFWVTVKDGYTQAAQDLNAKIDVLSAPTENDVNSQLSTCETMVSTKYDALVVHTITASNLIPCIVKGTKENVLMVDPDGRIDIKAVGEAGGKLVQGKTLDFVDQGRIGAQYIVDQLGAEGGEVAIIEGLPGAPQSEDRRDGAKAVFEGVPNIKLVAVQAADWDRTKALNVSADILQAHPNIRGFYCANDDMALAVAEAVASAGKQGQVLIVGTDFIADAKQAIKEGRMSGSVAFSPFIWGELATRMAIMAIEGVPLPATIHVMNVLVTKDNVAQMEDWK